MTEVITKSSRTPSTEKEILRRVIGADPERLFWLRLDEAKHYLVKLNNIDEEVAKKYISQPSFWDAWWLKLWAMTDRMILSKMDQIDLHDITWDMYVKFIRSTKKDKWIMTKVLPFVEEKIIHQ